MKKVSKIFNVSSKKYGKIYNDPYFSSKLLHQEKRIRSKLVEEIVINYLPPSRDNFIVDIGCGTGICLMNLRKKGLKARMLGVDVSSEMIKEANYNLESSKYEDIVFKIGTEHDLRVKADMVLSIGVSGYQENQEKFLQAISYLVDEQGYLIFSTGNGDSITRLIRGFLSRIDSHSKKIIKRNGLKFKTVKDGKVDIILADKGYKLEKKIYMTFGLGLGSSKLECYLDRLFFKYLTNNFLRKYLSLSAIYVYQKAEKNLRT